MIRPALTDEAFEAQSALTTIKSFAYGGVATEHEARASIVRLRERADAMERAIDGKAQELLPRRTD